MAPNFLSGLFLVAYIVGKFIDKCRHNTLVCFTYIDYHFFTLLSPSCRESLLIFLPACFVFIYFLAPLASHVSSVAVSLALSSSLLRTLFIPPPNSLSLLYIWLPVSPSIFISFSLPSPLSLPNFPLVIHIPFMFHVSF